MIQIHNYFNDLLLSVRSLFDNVIFPSKYMKHYEFNVANRTFVLSNDDYTTGYKFPSVIVTLNEENYSFGERTNVCLNYGGPSTYNQLRVLYDMDSQWQVFVQEEHMQVRISVVVNCESQYQAKEVDFRVKRYLPLNKFIALHEFTSFLEISPEILFTLGIDYLGGNVANLYTRLNRNTGKIEYCYSLRYQPLIRLESSTTTIQDSSQRSFPVNLELTYQIQMPMFVLGDKVPNLIERINLDFIRFGNDPIVSNSMRPLFNELTDDKYGNAKKVVKRNLLVHDLTDHDYTTIGDTHSFSVRFEKEDFVISPDYQFNIFDTQGKLQRDVQPSLIDTDINKITFLFSEEDFQEKYNTNLTEPIIIQFIEDRTELVDERLSENQ